MTAKLGAFAPPVPVLPTTQKPAGAQAEPPPLLQALPAPRPIGLLASSSSASSSSSALGHRSLSPSGPYTRMPMNFSQPRREGGITFAAQDKLPRLPIPDLENTCRRYLEALNPLQTAREHADTQQAVRDFLREQGPDLQEKLKLYAQDKATYIEQFCPSSPAQAVPFFPPSFLSALPTF